MLTVTILARSAIFVQTANGLRQIRRLGDRPDDSVCAGGGRHPHQAPGTAADTVDGLIPALFGLFVWIPRLIAHPEAHLSWSELSLTVLITGAAWIAAVCPVL